MGEIRIGMRSDVFIQGPPLIIFVPDSPAATADRQQLAQHFYLLQQFLFFRQSLGQFLILIFQFQFGVLSI